MIDITQHLTKEGEELGDGNESLFNQGYAEEFDVKKALYTNGCWHINK
mgnify:CR=1 FL=1